MLDQNYQLLLAKLIETLPNEIELPEDQGDFFDVSGPLPSYEDEQRSSARTSVRTKGILISERTLPIYPRSHEPKVVYTRDFSKCGVGLVASEQFFPGEHIRVILATFWMSIRVRRARRLGANCFEIGATLDHQFEPSSEAFEGMEILTHA